MDYTPPDLPCQRIPRRAQQTHSNPTSITRARPSPPKPVPGELVLVKTENGERETSSLTA